MSTILVIDRYELIFIPVHKCACTTIKKIYLNILGIERKIGDDNLYEYVLKLDGCKDIKDINNEEYKNYRVIWFVRNPFDRLVSLYNDMVKKYKYGKEVIKAISFDTDYSMDECKEIMKNGNILFKDFAQLIINTPNGKLNSHYTSQISGKKNVFLHKKLILYDINELDNFEEFLNYQYQIKLDKKLIIEKSNSTVDYRPKDMKVEDYYSLELKNRVYQFYRDDFIHLNYKTDFRILPSGGMFCLDKYSLIFIVSQKSGSTEIKRTFLYLLDCEYSNYNHKLNKPLINDLANKNQARFQTSSINEERYKDYRILFFTRNPLERLFSGYVDKIINMKEKFDPTPMEKKKWKEMTENYLISFEDFVRKLSKCSWKNINHHFHPQVYKRKNIFEHPNLILYDIENLDSLEDFITSKLNIKLGKELTFFGRENPKKDLNKYCIETKELVYELYNEDYKLLKYKI